MGGTRVVAVVCDGDAEVDAKADGSDAKKQASVIPLCRQESHI